MKRPDFHRIFWITFAVHAVVIVALCGLMLVRGCRVRPKPLEIVTYIDVQTALPEEVAIQPVDEVARPEPEPEPPAPEPEEIKPPPPEPPKDIPEEPPKEKPVEKPVPKPPEPPKEKPKEKPKIELGPRVVKKPEAPPKPKLTPQQIRDALARGLPTQATSSMSEFPFAWYLSLVRQTMYDAWKQPSGLSASSGFYALVEIEVRKDGTITRRSLVRPSGHAAMDQSVMAAVRSVERLKPLPDGYAENARTITIEFRLSE